MATLTPMTGMDILPCDDFGEFIIEKVIEKRKEHHFVEIEETYLDEDGTKKVRAVPKDD